MNDHRAMSSTTRDRTFLTQPTDSYLMLRTTCTALFFLAISGAVFAAEIDTVVRKSDGKIFGGEITKVARSEVVVTQKVGNKVDSIAANDIASLEWKGEPLSLGLARSNETSGNLAEALEGYQEALKEAASARPEVRASIEFSLARTAVRVSQTDPSQTAAAIDKLKAFVSANPDSFLYYDCQLMLGDLALRANDTATAEGAYAVLEQAPWPDYQLAGRNGQGFSRLARNDVSGARGVFDSVAAAEAANPSENARRLEGVIGQAECLRRESKYAEAVTLLNQVVEQARAEDSRLLALAYVKQGDCLAADGQQAKAAVVAYLHVDVIPALAANADLHAEALYQLTKLWLAINQPQRSADAVSKLQSEYPTSEWTQKLSQ